MNINVLVNEMIRNPQKMYQYGEINPLIQNNLFKRKGARRQQPKRVTYKSKVRK